MHTLSDKVRFVQRKPKPEEAFRTKKWMVLAEHLLAQAHIHMCTEKTKKQKQNKKTKTPVFNTGISLSLSLSIYIYICVLQYYVQSEHNNPHTSQSNHG